MASDGQLLRDSEVIALEKNIVDRFESIKGQMTRLQGTIDQLEGHWRGIGAAAFNKKQVEINEHMRDIGQLLVKFLDNINATRKDKDNLEDQVRATIDSIDVQYGGKHSALNGY
ncbi:WXG100 family type VII secretion target [Streptomyces abyssomicinicus]|uniref:WXG100 family type VII secretion target n=1 Tax=Streptomyces abyssomicinicus TaxID=574929 RepID=UPI001250621E|nr:WXG100 family type VII secretion target [Streptomyces abyssomicinicus]